MVFDGYDNNPDDGTVVVTGDLGEAFGADNILYRNVRSQKEIKEKMALWEQLKSLPESAAGRDEIQKQIFAYRAMEDGKLTLKAHSSFSLYDFYGNVVNPRQGVYEIPLTFRGTI